ncbi:MAG: nucleotidyltransferase domain-containing protein [Mycobacteriales bacterium]
MRRETFPIQVSDVLSAVDVLVTAVSGITAVALVGSWARDEGRAGSDIDLIVLAEVPQNMLQDTDWFAALGRDAQLVAARDFGAIQERRLRLPNGLEIEVGIGRPDWASTDPLDQGTAAVVRDGLVPIFDRDGVLADLIRAVR